MLDRRDFFKVAGMTGVASLGALGATAAEAGSGRDCYELRTYTVETAEQKQGFETFMADAAIPALNRAGVDPVGVFLTPGEVGPIYVLLRHASLESVAVVGQKLLADSEYLEKGASFLDAPAESPAYKRVEIALLAAFTGMPHIEKPSAAPGRVIQLRIYESPSVKTGQKKIEMFNTAEIAIFRKVGLTPVLFGEALAGSKMPNLTYMLAFDDMEANKAAWDRFRADPDWLALKAKPEYSDKAILCGITNLLLEAAKCSQI